MEGKIIAVIIVCIVAFLLVLSIAIALFCFDCDWLRRRRAPIQD